MVGIPTKCLNLAIAFGWFSSNAFLNSQNDRMKPIFLAIGLPLWPKGNFDVRVALCF
jgi:hypothetical protein